MVASSSSSSSSSSANNSASDGIRFPPLEQAMQFIGFQIERATPDRVEGRFVVSETFCQPFHVLHPGIELNINHLRAAPVGTDVFASAKRLHLGKTLQVWSVTLSEAGSLTKSDSQEKENSALISVSRVTLITDLTGGRTGPQQLKSYARL